jgi:hypothetical protein
MLEFRMILGISEILWGNLMSDMTKLSQTSNDSEENQTASPGALSRRHLISGMAGLLAGAGLAQAQQPPASAANPQPPKPATLADLKGPMPKAKIGNLEVSRMIFGGNLLGGWAHSRDLPYVSKLTLAYNTNEKICETLALAEKCGINTLLTSPVVIPVIKEYWNKAGGKIQFISDCGRGELLQAIQLSIDSGATACYIHGQVTDGLVQKEDFDKIAKGLELIRKNKMPAGLGAHKLETIKACVAKGFSPDFWMKTFHRVNYWSAQIQPEHDNIWCVNPEDTKAFMKDLKEPWIAFKTMAAGALPPKDAFKYAFDSGADFICVGMFDWQVVDDANLAMDALAGVTGRERPWRA